MPRVSRKFHIAASFAALLLGFFLILGGLSAYKYFTTKSRYASQVLSRINKDQIELIRTFFDQISNQLTTVRDLGRTGLFPQDEITTLNQKFIPLLQNQEMISGILLADDGGHEYFIYKKSEKWITRVLKPEESGTVAVFQEWKTANEPITEWEKRIDYDPRKRPWFHAPPPEDGVHWSPVYAFHESGRPGITASIAWKKPRTPEGFVVFAVDIPLDHFKKLLKPADSKFPGILFLVNPQTGRFILGEFPGRDAAATKSSPPPSEKVISTAVRKWRDLGAPQDQAVEVSVESGRWLVALRPLTEGKEEGFWIGIASPEAGVMAELKKTLFHLDLVDMAIAFSGSVFIALFLWKIAGLGAASRRPENPVDRFRRYLASGEGERVEFKSTVRTNLKTGKTGKEIELAWLKAVVAFLNTQGGVVLLGVDDAGTVVGLEADGFENPDKCQLHIKNLIHQHIGGEYAGFIRITLVEIHGKTAVMVECSPAHEPVFLKIGKNEEFYVRSGPSSMKLSPSQTVSYVLQNRKNFT